MKVRRVVVEIEVPFEVKADAVLEGVEQCFDDIVRNGGKPIPHQAQVVSDELSTNNRIGGAI